MYRGSRRRPNSQQAALTLTLLTNKPRPHSSLQHLGLSDGGATLFQKPFQYHQLSERAIHELAIEAQQR